MRPPLVFLLSVLVGSSSGISRDDPCSFEVILSETPRVILTQRIYGDDDDLALAVKLSCEGQRWAGIGFNQDGRMIGSTVVVGLPDRPITSANPGRYFLGSKDLSEIDRVNGNGALVDAPWRAADVAYDEDDDGGEWKRGLFVPPDDRSLLDISNALIYQNTTHTTLQFTRPFNLPDGARSMTSVSVHPSDLNTLIWAVGTGNGFGYHGSLKGSLTMQFTEYCPHGTLAPSQSPSTEAVTGAPHYHTQSLSEDGGGTKIVPSKENSAVQSTNENAGAGIVANLFVAMLCWVAPLFVSL